MKINIRGNKIVITDGIKNHVESKLKKLEKYFDNHEDVCANVVAKVSGRDQVVEVTIPTSHFTLRAEEVNDDLYAAVDLVVDKLERQIRKNKSRLEKKLKKEKVKEMNFDFDIDDIEMDNNKIVKRKTYDMKPMSEDEAILQMNLLSHTFFIFKNSKHNNICVLYKRKDGNYGIIEID